MANPALNLPPDTPVGEGPRGRILVIDDEPDIRESLEALLTSENYRVELAANATEAFVGLCELGFERVELVVVTVDALGDPSTSELAAALVSTGVPVVAVALRGPWDADAYPEVDTVLATYGIQTPSLVALADALAGVATITGVLPVRLRSG